MSLSFSKKKAGNKRRKLNTTSTQFKQKVQSSDASSEEESEDERAGEGSKRDISDVNQPSTSLFTKHKVQSNGTVIEVDGKRNEKVETLPIMLRGRQRMDGLLMTAKETPGSSGQGAVLDEAEVFKKDVASRPKEQELNRRNYRKRPIQGFGEMILKKYGWKPPPAKKKEDSGNNIKSSSTSAIKKIISEETTNREKRVNNAIKHPGLGTFSKHPASPAMTATKSKEKKLSMSSSVLKTGKVVEVKGERTKRKMKMKAKRVTIAEAGSR